MEINNLKMTKHALNRSQQRGIKLKMINFVISHADKFRLLKEGGESYFISNKKLRSLISEFRLKPSDFEKLANLVVVESAGKILTVFKSTRPQPSL